jgi:hypothetical protein
LADPHDPAHVVCPRCQNILDSTKELPDFAEVGAAREGTSAADFDPEGDLEAVRIVHNLPEPGAEDCPEWDWDFEFSSLDPWLDDSAAQQHTPSPAPAAVAGGHMRHTQAAPRSVLPPALPAAQILPAQQAPAPLPQSNWIAWLVISAGVMLFMCGGVLLGWSLFSQQTLLWRVGLPASLFGQALLIVGLVLQLESLWHVHRLTSQSLRKLGGELKHLEHATTMLASTHSTAAQSFYVHLAERASPHLLLADLKGQLDVLAMRLAQQAQEEAA